MPETGTVVAVAQIALAVGELPMCENRPAVLTATIDLCLARDKRIGELNDLLTDRRPDLYARLWDVA